MAKTQTGTFLPSKDSQQLLLSYVKRVLEEHKKDGELLNKMEAIDVAYARFTASTDSVTGIAKGDGIDAATTPVGVHNMPSTTPPLVVSQVDSTVSYLADVFLSGTPMFPIVSNPSNKEAAEQLETLLDDHARLGGYARQLLLFLRDAVKYNLGAIEADWTSIEQYSSIQDLVTPGSRKLQKDNKSYTKIKRLDPYNTIKDRNVLPGDISCEGDYAGYIELLSRPKMKRLLNRLSNDNEAFNTKEAFESGYIGEAGDAVYRIPPQISNYVNARKPLSGINWYSYLTGTEDTNSNLYVENYELITLYVRIIPKDYNLNVPHLNSPQIWKLRIVNQELLVSAKRVISAYDYIPILFGQPLEDGLAYQTQSVAEGTIPFQEAAKTLFNIRFNAARRAVADRALYDPMVINPHDINSPVPAAKIPVRSNSLDPNKTIASYYHQIPFDARGTETTVQDGILVSNFSKDLSGYNNPMQGQFQKGNKSVKEWDDVMGNADARARLPALTLEYQVFYRLKEILKLNIYQYGDDAEVVSQKNGSVITVDINALRQKVLAFRVADGYTPKSKLASTDSIIQAMQNITQSPILQQFYGPMLPQMFGHLMQLLGVRGFEEYSPNAQQASQNALVAAQLQQGVNPNTGLPMIGVPNVPPQ